jgi:hypothetical protein
MNLTELLAAMDALALTAQKPKLITIEGLGAVHVREITIGEIDAQVADTTDKANKLKIARGATRLLSDENGNRLLDPDNDEHVAKMAKLPLRVLTAINATQETPEGN